MDSDKIAELKRGVAELDWPWSQFSLERAERYDIRGQKDYDAHDLVRELIYARFGDESSISMGKLPPIVSPMFWEAISGTPREKILSIKNRGQPIPPKRYARYRQMGRYWPSIKKIYPINLADYRGSLLETYNLGGWSKRDRDVDLDRRIAGLSLFKASVSRGEWPALLLIVPDSPEVGRVDDSFTITPHMEVRIIRGEGLTEHQGYLYYCPIENDYLRATWNKRWNLSIFYASSRSYWPSDLIFSNSIFLFKEKCVKFNIGSLERMENFLLNLKSTQGAGGPVERATSLSVERVFLCHATEDKGAIVKRFDHACRAKGIQTWYDENEISWGDDIVGKVNFGLAEASKVVVFISKDSLEKSWPRRELESALNLGISKQGFVLPLLLGISHETIRGKYPLLAGMRAMTIPDYDPLVEVDSVVLDDLVGKLATALRR